MPFCGPAPALEELVDAVLDEDDPVVGADVVVGINEPTGVLAAALFAAAVVLLGTKLLVIAVTPLALSTGWIPQATDERVTEELYDDQMSKVLAQAKQSLSLVKYVGSLQYWEDDWTLACEMTPPMNSVSIRIH